MDQTFEPKITEGRIVRYVLPDGPHAGDARPAMVVRVWSPTCVNLQVFLDGVNDFEGDPDVAPNLRWVTSATLDPSAKEPGSWHWPPR